MDNYYLEWANLLLRWVHVITAIAWIGASFYFVFLDNSLTVPVDNDLKAQGANGELWAVHGGGFYHPVKFNVSPPKIPNNLHWFYWESYSAWISGFTLFTLTYLWNSSTYLIDITKVAWTPFQAVTLAISFLIVFWLLYNFICQKIGHRKNGDLWVGILVFLLISCAAWLACLWFSGRAAFLLIGAMLATTMSASVFFWIIPGQKKVIAAINSGESVDPIHGQRGKQRSVHNTYFTLPVLFSMLSGHYSFLYNHPKNWLILILMMFSGAAIRQFFVMRHGYKLGRHPHPWPYAFAGCITIMGVIFWLKPNLTSRYTLADKPASYSSVKIIMEKRCYMCHGAQLQMKNIRLDSPGLIKLHASNIYQQVVVTKAMPMNNSTEITQEEREIIKNWFISGALTTP